MDDPTDVANRASLEEKVMSVVRRVAGAIAPTRAVAAPTDSLIRDLGYDSLTLMELAFAMEDIFALEPIDMEETMMVDTVADLSGFVAGKIAAGKGTFPTRAEIDERLMDLPQ